MSWQRMDLSDPTAEHAARVRSEAILADDARRHLFHTLDWMLDATDRGPEAVYAFFLEAPDGTVGYAPFQLQPWRLRFRLGELTLLARQLVRFQLVGGPLFGPAGVARDETALTRELFHTLPAVMRRGQIVFAEGVPLDSCLGRLLTGPEQRALPFRVVRYGRPFTRHLIPLPVSFDDYLGQLGKRTREGLRRKRRKLDKHVSGEIALVPCTTPEEVDAFVDAATAVSRKTYQWHLLGLGLRDPEGLKCALRALAQRGWTRSFLLTLRGEPAAFMIGYQFRETYYYIDVGFDPDWQTHSVGTVMHLEVLRHLLETDPRPVLFDFSTGTGVHKERFGTVTRTEANYLLFPRGLRGQILAWAYRSTDCLSDALVGLADRLGLKAALKKAVRRLAVRKKG